jgi:hypothetical protein
MGAKPRQFPCLFLVFPPATGLSAPSAIRQLLLDTVRPSGTAEICLQLAGGVIDDRHPVFAQQLHEGALGIARQFRGLATR